MGVRYDHPVTGKVQADGNITITDAEANDLADSTKHQVMLVPETATSGTAAVYIKRRGDSTYRALLDEYGAPVVLNIASPKAYIFEGLIDGIQLQPTSITGSTGLYGARFSGWN